MSLESISVSDVMTKDVKVEEQNQNIFALSKIMSDNNIGSVIIIDNHNTRNPVGIVTERDIIRILGTLKPDLMQTPVKELMTHPIIPLSSQATVADAIKLMNERKIRRIPIVDKNNKLVGIVTENDIFKIVANSKDLLTSIVDSTSNIAQKSMHNEFLQFWFSNSFIK